MSITMLSDVRYGTQITGPKILSTAFFAHVNINTQLQWACRLLALLEMHHNTQEPKWQRVLKQEAICLGHPTVDIFAFNSAGCCTGYLKLIQDIFLRSTQHSVLLSTTPKRRSKTWWQCCILRGS